MALSSSFLRGAKSACAKQFKTFADLSEKLKMDVTDLMRQCNAKVPAIQGPGQRLGAGTGHQRGQTRGRTGLVWTPNLRH
jgi:hypothetical protein